MDVKEYFEIAEYCRGKHNSECDPCDSCRGPVDKTPCPDDFETAQWGVVIDIKNHYENLLIKQSEFNDRVNGQLIQDRWDERSRVIAEVKEMIIKLEGDTEHDNDYYGGFGDA